MGLVRIGNYFFYRGGSRRADSRAPMLIGTRTRVNVSRVTGRLSREITTQARCSRHFGTEHTQPGSATPATTGHRLLASAAASGEGAVSDEVSVLLSA